MSDSIKTFKTSYVWLPVVIGLAVVGWMFYREFNSDLFSHLRFSRRMAGGLLLAILFMSGRDGGLMWRFRFLTGNELTWQQAFRVNMLSEFTSAITPSAVGGSSLIVLFLNKEGINAGRSTTLMISCLFLDELFLVVACPLALLLFSFDDLFGNVDILSSGIEILFFIVYGAVTLWTFVLYMALFRRPQWIRPLLMAVFRLRLLKRWKPLAEELADNLVLSSQEMSRKSFSFWLKAFGITCVAWVSRYLVVNALLMAFTSSGRQLLAFVRQLVLWVVMMVSPTPGGSGVSEYMFHVYYSDFFDVAGVVLVVTFIWRIITYYTYLAIGACIIPGWVKKLKR